MAASITCLNAHMQIGYTSDSKWIKCILS